MQMMIANTIDQKLSKKAGLTMKDFEVWRSLTLLSECSKNFTKSKMQTALRGRFASILYCSLTKLGWISDFINIDNLTNDLREPMLEKS